MLTPDMRAVLDVTQRCFAASVTPDGHPNLSPKGTIRVWDDQHLFFLEIASPGTRANLAHTPRLELNVVDQLSRCGYRFAGTATVHWPPSSIYTEAVARIYGTTAPSGSPVPLACLEIRAGSAAEWSVQGRRE